MKTPKQASPKTLTLTLTFQLVPAGHGRCIVCDKDHALWADGPTAPGACLQCWASSGALSR
jgi:hypothetical protein